MRALFQKGRRGMWSGWIGVCLLLAPAGSPAAQPPPPASAEKPQAQPEAKPQVQPPSKPPAQPNSDAKPPPQGQARTSGNIFESDAPPVPGTPLDKLVYKKLQSLKYEPKLCSDAVFVRRVYLDTIGTLPSAKEVRDFLQDEDPNKFGALIDRLLERDEFAEYWSMKWGDILRIKAEFPVNLWPNAAQAYHRWVLESIRTNMPYDQFARKLLTSSGSNFRVGPVNFYRAIQNRTPEGIAAAVALTFMGVRTDAWPAEKLSGMAAFFAQVGYKPSREWKEEIVVWDPLGVAAGFANTAPPPPAPPPAAGNTTVTPPPAGGNKPPSPPAPPGTGGGNKTASPAPAPGTTNPPPPPPVAGNTTVTPPPAGGNTPPAAPPPPGAGGGNKTASPAPTPPAPSLAAFLTPVPTVKQRPETGVFPDGTKARLGTDRDPREIFADWLIKPRNPWFTRNIVNRMWAWLFGRGIIHEPDDIREGNPPCNPELLEYLQKEMIANKYDMKRMFRMILNSKTYRFSSLPGADAEQATLQFGIYGMRRLDAEVLIDAINQITGTSDLYTSAIPEPFTYIPQGEPAIALADGSITSPFLALFGRSARATGMENERDNKPVAAQWLHLLNSSHIQQKLEQSPRLKALVDSKKSPPEILEELYLTILSRFPTEEEVKAGLAYGKAGAPKRREDWVDLAWALINSKEFLYKH